MARLETCDARFREPTVPGRSQGPDQPRFSAFQRPEQRIAPLLDHVPLP
ncbi:hypothetical protein MBUL_00811 [Methylobacterium bullatum]|uniref:Uncharacterized protein n=1 Tax=Methylobacterium bullatum TaxID=570505 RepID=A0A679IYK4_9HYPH|nr:hypothetical protein MBUL_00811 [Methylobacterium bullatum]